MASVVLLIGLSGCATPARSPIYSGAETSKSTTQNSTPPSPVLQREENLRSYSGASSASQLHPAEPNEASDAPYAVIKLDPKNGRLTREMEARLLLVANEAKKDDRIILRLEAYVPDGGSPALSISVANKSLQIVRDRLLELGIPTRRIVQASFGQEHDGNRNLRRHWVEIYLVKTGGLS